ncbi:hypothetical protein A6E27_24955 [Bacillus cereus]|nr:hypothetical protein A6E27_24955 [Bacillus cereus]
MFKGDFRFWGKHATMADELLDVNEGVFDTLYDLVLSAAIVGFISRETAKETGDRNSTKTIFSDKWSREHAKTDLIVKTLLLADKKVEGIEQYSRSDRALRFYTEPDVGRLNQEYLKGYALKGIEILYQELKNQPNNMDIVSYINYIMNKYVENDDVTQKTHDLIIGLSKKAY